MTNYSSKDFLYGQSRGLLNFATHFSAPNGGTYWLDSVGEPDAKQGVETWITSRMAHSYSLAKLCAELPNEYGQKSCDRLIDDAIRGLTGILHDDENGGWYAKVDIDGAPLDDAKAAYAHAFVILASSSAMLAGNEQAKDLFYEALSTFERYFWDEKAGMSYDLYNRDFSELNTYRGINANMHTVEAFLAAYDALSFIGERATSEIWLKRAGRVVNRVCEWASENRWRIPEHFNEKWEVQLEFNSDKPADQFKPYGATVGHGLEWSRLILQYALAAENANLLEGSVEEYAKISTNIFQTAVKDGWEDNEGFVYTTDWQGSPVVKDRMHWVAAEGIGATSTLFHYTGQQVYKDWYTKIWDYTVKYIIDSTGSWRHQLNQNNQLSETVWAGKPDIYHALQACLIPLNYSVHSIATAIAKSSEVNSE